MKKISKAHHSSLSELNITPLLDLAFVLLVIFIITTPQLSNNLEMSLPSGDQSNTNSAAALPKINDIRVDAAGRITFNEELMTKSSLRYRLYTLQTNDPATSVVVRGSGDAEYQVMVGVFDAIQQASITNVGLATEAQ